MIEVKNMYKQDSDGIKKIFNLVVEKCKRSSTKELSLNSVLLKDQLLVKLLQETTETYGINIAAQFQRTYEEKKPALSFLFAQITNFILEKTFHVGSCQLQADVALFELCKKRIFNVSLICSNPRNELTQHWYLMILDENTFKNSSSWKGVFTAVEPHKVSKTTLYFDTWSNQLCEWKDFKPDSKNRYLKDLKNLKQASFTPLIHLFKDEENLLEKIIWCLTTYENNLKDLQLAEKSVSNEYKKLFTSSNEEEFQKEVEFLFNSSECLSKLLTTIEIEKKEFQECLTAIKQSDKKTNEEKNIKLINLTSAFFQPKAPTQWKEYPKNLVSQNATYAGHDLRFFTLPQNDTTTKQQATDFATHLKEKGFSVEQKEAKGKPSLLVDLTTSSCGM